MILVSMVGMHWAALERTITALESRHLHPVESRAPCLDTIQIWTSAFPPAASMRKPIVATSFLLGLGAEMIMEIARFWSSIAHFNPERGR